MVFAGEAVKYGVCQSQCLQIQPNCSAWCKRIGYPDGGECVQPRFIDCCCWEIYTTAWQREWNGNNRQIVVATIAYVMYCRIGHRNSEIK